MVEGRQKEAGVTEMTVVAKLTCNHCGCHAEGQNSSTYHVGWGYGEIDIHVVTKIEEDGPTYRTWTHRVDLCPDCVKLFKDDAAEVLLVYLNAEGEIMIRT